MEINIELNTNDEDLKSNDTSYNQPTDESLIYRRCKCGNCACYDEPEKYNPDDLRLGICCIYCKTSTMINVRKPLCRCLKREPCYAETSDSKGVCCIECKTPSMVIIATHRPKKLTLKIGDTLTFEWYNWADGTTSKYTRVVRYAGRFGVDYFCPGVLGHECPYKRTANPKYRFTCTECFRRGYPTDPLTFKIRGKTKEIAVRDFINQNFEGFHHDIPLQTCGDCTVRRRIDHYKLFGSTLLSIETDEHQHTSYSKKDEETRYNDIVAGFTSKHIFIRFNPDEYKNSKGQRRNPSMQVRLEILKREIEKQISRISNNDNTELIERVFLFYNGFEMNESDEGTTVHIKIPKRKNMFDDDDDDDDDDDAPLCGKFPKNK
jgi:hypothetical protein